MPDPAVFVDRFEVQVNSFLDWRRRWLLPDHGVAIRQSEFYMQRGNIAEHWISQAARLLESQKAINSMMLATIDDLKGRLENLERT